MQGPRVTLSDFAALQNQLLETRKQLYDSREREQKTAAALAAAAEDARVLLAFSLPVTTSAVAVAGTL